MPSSIIHPCLDIDFYRLLPLLRCSKFLQTLEAEVTDKSLPELSASQMQFWSIQWRQLQHSIQSNKSDLADQSRIDYELTQWLIEVFNQLFAQYRVILVRGAGEPEYIAPQGSQPARIEFAHGFFASALHEISHWCIAGTQRRTQNDYGYWYAPDGRDEAQQRLFEQVEIKPQALEALFSLATERPFRVSQDNLYADFDTSDSTFVIDVYQQAKHYLDNPSTIPRDAKILLVYLIKLCSKTSEHKSRNVGKHSPLIRDC